MSRFQCPCCDNYTFEDADDAFFEICSVCFWQNDFTASDKISGANHMTLSEGRKNFIKFGACDLKFSSNVRKAFIYELPENNLIDK